jgi:hypothetical protein
VTHYGEQRRKEKAAKALTYGEMHVASNLPARKPWSWEGNEQALIDQSERAHDSRRQ